MQADEVGPGWTEAGAVDSMGVLDGTGPGWISWAAGPAQWHNHLARRSWAGVTAHDQAHRRAAGLIELYGDNGMALAGSHVLGQGAALPWLCSDRRGFGMVGAHQVELVVTPPRPPQTAWQQLAAQQHEAWGAEEGWAERQRILAGGYAGRSWADWRRRAKMEKAAADSHRRRQVAIHCNGLGRAMAGLVGHGGAGLEREERWELEEATARREEETRMDCWSFRDKDDY